MIYRNMPYVAVMTLKTIYEDIRDFKKTLKNGRDPREAIWLRRDAMSCYKTEQYELLKASATYFEENCLLMIKKTEAIIDECLKVDEKTLIEEAIQELKESNGSESITRNFEKALSKM